ncbi:uncharacterized protein LOC116845935 [Odontomachus brunneus]|uniref:uncharacterized protein LOC116845935 n=1 Tax=Odontomachus brunneus TaxID=486640 RepID=UPI0013F1A033|nr:uncharacterized protein LOC116845935 [Odontomachus brunneus]
MYPFDNRNYKLNQTFLKFLGLWPYKKTKFQRLRAICFNALLFSYMIVQLTQFTIVDFHLDVVIRILGEAFPAIIYFIKFNLFFYDAEMIKQILERIINDWRIFTDIQEIKIVEHYARQGRQLMIFLISFTSVAVFGYATMVMMPDILNYYLPLNESRIHYLSPVNEYSGYQNIYFYPLFLYIMASVIIGMLTLVAVGSMLMSIILHICAIFKISSYWMEHIVDKEIIARSDRQYVIIERIIKSVELHRNAQKLIEMLMSSYIVFLSSMTSIGVISLSLNLFRVSATLSSLSLVNIFRILSAS